MSNAETAAEGLSLFDLPGRRALAARADWNAVLARIKVAASAATAPTPEQAAVQERPLVWRACDEG